MNLTTRDIHVLEKIRDPESNPAAAISIDTSLPSDPHVVDKDIYQHVTQRERDIIASIQRLELQLVRRQSNAGQDLVVEYRRALSSLDNLITEYPEYASARNNRAQVLRRLYGDTVLVVEAGSSLQALVQNPGETERREAAGTALADLDRSISLLSPTSPYASLSQQAAKTLSMAHTQRAAIYHATSKLLASPTISIHAGLCESKWTKLEFEEAASRDFALGGRYGNDIAKGLAVTTNPTAKLCGQIVRQAMEKEYGPGFVN
jgi:hypothetical protein